MTIGIGADHLATGRIKWKICAGAAADLQNCELPAWLLELGETAEQVLLLVVHFLVVHYGAAVQTDWEESFVYFVQAHGLDQMEGDA